jgi:viroplasmin and RNaseH domain-containing protein
MSNIIPPSINDKLNNMMEYIKYLYKAFVSFTKNFYVDSSQNVRINSNTLTINTPNSSNNSSSMIYLNNNGQNIVNILYGITSKIPLDNAPNGSLYLNNGNDGELYLRVNGEWVKISP